LAEQLGISLTIAFSEATQPLTLTSTEETSEDGFAIFCAIATTTSDAFDPPRCKVQIRSGSSSERKVTRSLSESDGNGPKRQMSEQPKKKTRLDFGGSQRAAVVVNSAPATTSNGGRDLRFFLPSGRWNVAGSQTREAGPSGNQTEDAGPSGSQVEGAGPSWNQTEGAGQRGSQTEGAGPSMSQSDIPFPPKSQRFRMTQQEMLDLSGFQGVRPEDLVDEMDYAEEEEERQGIGIDGSQREGDENRPPVEMSQGESRLFEPDLTILVADERDVPRMERSEEPMQDERARAVDEESGLDDWEELMPLTQASADEREVSLLSQSLRVFIASKLTECSFHLSLTTSELLCCRRRVKTDKTTNQLVMGCIIYLAYLFPCCMHDSDGFLEWSDEDVSLINPLWEGGTKSLIDNLTVSSGSNR